MLRQKFLVAAAAALSAVWLLAAEAGAGEFVIKAGKEWAELPVASEIIPGSILDFSRFTTDAPAGKHGRLIINKKTGNWEFERKPGQPVRLVGANLCYSANFLEKEESDKIAKYFRLMGYNTIRLHHYDVNLIKGDWNSTKSDDISPEQLDKLDYLFAALKKEGLYVTIDLMSSRRFGKGEIKGYDKLCHWEIKAVFPIIPDTVNAWAKFASKLLNHVNPYTGMTWKDDPTLISICPLNEDTIYSVWGNKNVKPYYEAGFAKWLEEKGKKDAKDLERKQLLLEYLMTVKTNSNKDIDKYFAKENVKTLITGSNWWDTKIQAWPRSEFDFVDNHGYDDHPYGWPDQRWNQKNPLNSNNRRYMLPVFKMPARIFGKPYTISEWNFCMPNKFRACGGALMGAYAALQNWDGLYRFAWSHDRKSMFAQRTPSGFDIATDPLNILTEKLVVLLFGRGDVAPAKKKYVYAVTMKDAIAGGEVDMWGKGLFSDNFNAMGFISQIGSQWIEGSKKIEGKFDGVIAPEDPGAEKLGDNSFIALNTLPIAGYVPNRGGVDEIVSDTGELTINHKNGTFKVVTPKTECLVGSAKTPLSGKALAVADSSLFSSVSASAMDGKNLENSASVLLLHLTNVQASQVTFTNANMVEYAPKRKFGGALPYLVRRGEVTITLKNSNPGLKVYALGFDGKRGAEVKADYADGAYTFKAETAPAGLPARMLYELGK